jgi:hypothetical protein
MQGLAHVSTALLFNLLDRVPQHARLHPAEWRGVNSALQFSELNSSYDWNTDTLSIYTVLKRNWHMKQLENLRHATAAATRRCVCALSSTLTHYYCNLWFL